MTLDLNALTAELVEEEQAASDRRRLAEEALFLYNIINDTLPEGEVSKIVNMSFRVDTPPESEYDYGFFERSIELTPELVEDLGGLLQQLLDKRLKKLGL